MEYVRTRTIVITGLVLTLVAVLAIVTLREVLRPGPGCTTALGDGAVEGHRDVFLSGEAPRSGVLSHLPQLPFCWDALSPR